MDLGSRAYLKTIMMLLVLTAVLGGCGGDDDPTDPVGQGTIGILQNPDVLAGAGWSLTGPRSESGNADIILNGCPAGQYTLTWHNVAGSITPSTPAQNLAAGKTITFDGTYTDDLPNTGYILAPAGNFIMGSPETELGRVTDEIQHVVTLTTPFYMLRTEVTNAQYRQLVQWAYDIGYCTVTGNIVEDNLDGSTNELLDMDGFSQISFSGGIFIIDSGKENFPVLGVTWEGSAAYCDWMNLHAGLPRSYDHSSWLCNNNEPYSAAGYRLPTEAEWEYACRAGSETSFANGEITDVGCNDPVLDLIGWYCGNSGDRLVGQLAANDWGLFDMHGNLGEWCNDIAGVYEGAVTDPAGPASGSGHGFRSGLWMINSQYCRSASRHFAFIANVRDYIGFRIVMSSHSK